MLDPHVKREGIALAVTLAACYAGLVVLGAVLQLARHGAWPWQ